MLYERLKENFYNAKQENTVSFYIKNIKAGIVKEKTAKILAKELNSTFILQENKLFLNVSLQDNFAKITSMLNSCLAKLQQIDLVDKIRNEDFFVRSYDGSKILAKADRSIIPILGTPAFGVHVNCFDEESKKLWVAQRSANTYTHPNKLDNLVGGGVNASCGIFQTMQKEALEEAFINEELSKNAKFREIIHYQSYNQSSYHIRNDYLYIFDLKLPKGFTPFNQDNENQAFLLLENKELKSKLYNTDDFKFNSELVVLSYLIRNQLIDDENIIKTVDSLIY